jgi:hypothetical protein
VFGRGDFEISNSNIRVKRKELFHNSVPQLNWKEEMHIEDFLYYDTKLLSQLGVRNSKSIYYKVKK